MLPTTDAEDPVDMQDPPSSDSSDSDDSYDTNHEPLHSVKEESPFHYDDDSTSFPEPTEHSRSHIPVTEVPNTGDDTDVRAMAKRATQHIRFWRVIVMLTLLCVGTAASCGVWFGLGYLQEQQVRARYRSKLDSALDFVSRRAQQLETSSQTFASSMIQLAGNESFPFVTLPLFDALATQMRQLSGVVATIYSPVVSNEDRIQWERYSTRQQSTWLPDDYGSIFPYIYSLDTSVMPPQRTRSDPSNSYLPLWQTSPLPSSSFDVNANRLDDPLLTKAATETMKGHQLAVMTEAVTLDDMLKHGLTSLELVIGSDVSPDALYSYLIQPVVRNTTIVGYLQHIVPLKMFLELSAEYAGLDLVVTNNKGQAFTYRVTHDGATLRGKGDLHEPAFTDTDDAIPLLPNEYCDYTVVFYASRQLYNSLLPDYNVQLIATIVTAVTFFLLLIGFAAYDSFVARRNRVVINAAARSNAILSSLFPTNVRARLFHRAADQHVERTESHNAEDEEEEMDEVMELQEVNRTPVGVPKMSMGKRGSMLGSVFDMGSKVTNTAISSVMQIPKLSLKTFLFEGLYDMEVEEADDDIGFKGKPIADLFTESTVLFADIAGFTAWASVREPTQVFTLLETLFRSFDEIAKKRKIFKVETVGDCYVAVTGVPEPQKDHAVIMCRFARECMSRMKVLTKKLEKTLGPDTMELDLRIGIHSGPVTAGVLRGERSRFQLFGDSMNTASRMESTGTKGRIQLSLDTAALLSDVGKGHWVIPREDRVIAKGKGEMQTYWLTTQREKTANGIECSADAVPNVQFNNRVDNKTASLIEWNTDVLLRLLRQIVARRMALQQINSDPISPVSDNNTRGGLVDETQFTNPMAYVIDEVNEIISLPNFDYKSIEKQIPPESVVIEPEVIEQLHDYVSKIANMYHDNHFHNFEHASHVTMSVTKLLSRIVAPSEVEVIESLNQTGKTLHDHTYGITSDPLTQFACVYSALIHDVDHHGVTNAQLIKEEKEIALIYKGKSVAEQNSINLAWNLLMQEEYRQLRECIYTSESSFKRFRQLVVNTVLATDIVDKDLKELRNARWAKAFYENHDDDDPRDTVNRKATIVIEHLIQASDVSHTMQHWHIYRKWNERFFLENFQSYHEGRSDSNPAETWYKGEIGFFDFYIIPLAKKLKDCGVFGVSSDEYLNYAERNRKEWEERGEEVVQEMVIKANKMYDRRNSLGENRRHSNDSQRRSSNGSLRRSSNGSQNRRTSNDSMKRMSFDGRRDSNDSQKSSNSKRGKRALRQRSSGF